MSEDDKDQRIRVRRRVSCHIVSLLIASIAEAQSLKIFIYKGKMTGQNIPVRVLKTIMAHKPSFLR